MMQKVLISILDCNTGTLNHKNHSYGKIKAIKHEQKLPFTILKSIASCYRCGNVMT